MMIFISISCISLLYSVLILSLCKAASKEENYYTKRFK